MFYHAESFKHSLCSPAWVMTKATNNLMFDGSDGRISTQFCNAGERELINRNVDPTNCPKCGKFKKSGRASCCAPGGTWFKNCGSAGNTKVNYKWTDGANACKPTKPAAVTPASSSTCAVCGSVKKSRKKSCCGRGGSWYKNCGTSGNKKSKKFDHTWFEGIQACKSKWASKSAFAAASFAAMNAAEKYVFNFANNTAKPSHEITTAATEVATTAAAPAKVATTFAATAKKTPLPTTDWIENDEVFEAFGVSGSASVFMSHLLAMFSIFIILLE